MKELVSKRGLNNVLFFDEIAAEEVQVVPAMSWWRRLSRFAASDTKHTWKLLTYLAARPRYWQ